MQPTLRDSTTVVALALVVVGGFVAPFVVLTTGVPAVTAADATGESPSDVPSAAQSDGQVAQQRAGGACNYTELFDRTIDSVVSVQRETGQGSGFLYRVEGNGSTSYVVTNAHVVGDASDVTVGFRRGESRAGTVVGRDVSSDLAVVEVTETPDYAEALPISDDSPEHGERVAALGSPFGLDETITHGIVSGLNRSLPTTQGYTIPNVVQTDAPISSGNSGGPLVTCAGEVVGVNTAGIAAQGAENIGFAVSSSLIDRIVPSLVRTGEFTHPTLGVSATGVTPTIAEANDLNVTQGVIVAAVDQDAPAAAVLQGSDRLERISGEIVPIGGDVIVAVEGNPVATREDLASILLLETEPGDEVTLTILRDGERMTVTTTVIERPDPRSEASQGPG